MKKSSFYSLVFLEGFSLIFFEILSAKMMNSFFGNSTYVWSVVLSITMFALALGYFLGGRLAKRWSNEKFIFWMFSGFVVFNLLSLAISNSIFNMFIDGDAFGGLITSALILIVPPVLFLGTLSPLFIQYAVNEFHLDKGYALKNVFTLSTFAGIFAALLLGYFLLELFGVTMNIILDSVLISGFVLYSGKLKTIFKVAFGLFVSLISFKMYSKTKVTSDLVNEIIYYNEGVLGQIKVMDKPLQNSSINGRVLQINGVSQTTILNTSDGYSNWRYPHVIHFFSLMKDKNADVLLLGLGGGSIANEIVHTKEGLDAVELDKRIIHVAQEYFYLKSNKIRFFNDDARHYINSCKKKYDLVIYDVLTGEIQPNYVFTKEALAELKAILKNEAIIIVNFQGIAKGKDKAFGSLYKTFKNAGFVVNYFADKLEKADDIIFVLSEKVPDAKQVDLTKLRKCCTINKSFYSYYEKPFNSYVPDLSKYDVLEDDKPLLEHLNFENTKYWRKDHKKFYFKDNLKSGFSQFN